MHDRASRNGSTQEQVVESEGNNLVLFLVYYVPGKRISVVEQLLRLGWKVECVSGMVPGLLTARGNPGDLELTDGGKKPLYTSCDGIEGAYPA